MEVNRLLSDELTYELQARGLPIGNTVAEKRLLLRESLRQERLGLSTPPTRCNMVADHELVVCTGKLGELRRAVGQFDDSNRDNEFRRIYTRLIHVSDRLKRIECVTPLLEAQRASLISDVNELVRELNLAYEEAREVVAEELQTKGATVAEHPQIDACVRESLGQDRKDSSLHESMPRDLIDLSDSGSLGAFQATQQDNSLIDMPNDLLPVVLHQQKERNREPPPRNFEVAPREQGCIFRRSFAKLHNDERPTQDQTLSARPSFQACDGIYQTPKELVAASIKEAKSHGTGDRNMGKPDMTYDRSRAQSPLTSTAWNTQPHKYLDSDDICLGSRSNQGSVGWSSTFREESMRAHASTERHRPFSVSENSHGGREDARFEDTRFLDVTRWKVQFDGTSSVTTFLERIEELRSSRGVSKERLLRSASELLTKEALLWFRMMGKFESWDDLADKLRSAFQPYDYEDSLWEEIRMRTQGAQEKVIIFVSVMENLFRKLRVLPPEESRVRIIRRNMLPYIQTQMTLHTVRTVSELLNLSKSIEETAWRVQKFCPPPTNTRQLLEPELAYQVPAQHRRSTLNRPPDVSPLAVDAVSLDGGSNQPLCWNCKSPGHKFRRCTRPRTIFCYRCGRENATSASCQNCLPKNSATTRQ
nr:unnamed protein product [Callosobruchus analis]